ncbi:MAG: SDR family NAD(P)-dependent oxidoreductase [Janthinobacterium lividum]
MAEQQRVALVTGGASGIGLAAVKRLAAKNFKVVILDRSEAAREVAAELNKQGHSALAVVADLADLKQIETAVAEINKQTGGADVVINNAGVHPKRDGRIVSLENMTVEDWEFVFRVNTTAPFLLCQAFIGHMKERKWGRIINIASRAGRSYSDRAGTHYSASKAALIGFTRTVAGAYALTGITANIVAPGQIETPLARTSDPKVLENAARQTPVGRLGTAEEVASMIEYLASDDSGFITGAVMDVNGGIFMG